MSDDKSKEGNRGDQNTINQQENAKPEGNKPDNSGNRPDAAAPPQGQGQEKDGHATKRESKREHHWAWKLAEVFGLWAAAGVGVVAVWIGNNDAEKQRGAMERQLTEMQREAVINSRAWVGPSDASIEKLTPMQGIKGLVMYGNVGREPTLASNYVSPQFYSRQNWDGGVAAAEIGTYQNLCMNSPIGISTNVVWEGIKSLLCGGASSTNLTKRCITPPSATFTMPSTLTFSTSAFAPLDNRQIKPTSNANAVMTRMALT